MPHVIVKMISGRSEQQKAALTEAITKAVMAEADCTETVVSILIEDVEKSRWADDVYRPDILGQWDKLAKKPDYNPL